LVVADSTSIIKLEEERKKQQRIPCIVKIFVTDLGRVDRKEASVMGL
jgi:hypothetical protein